MERLSDRAIAIVNELHTERLDYQSEYLPLIDALNQLAAYEDIELGPELLKDFVKLTLEVIGSGAVQQTIDLLKANTEGRLLVLPCGPGAELVREGKTFKADHWNVSLTAFREEPANRSGLQVATFSTEEAEKALEEVSKND